MSDIFGGDEDVTDTAQKHWDHKTPRSILSTYDLECIAHGISSALHYTSGTMQCDGFNGSLCSMCGNAMRLVIQSAEPKIIDAVLKRAAHAVGRQAIDLHPPSGDD